MPVRYLPSLVITIILTLICLTNRASASQALSLQETRTGMQEKISSHLKYAGKVSGKSSRLNRLMKKAERKIYKHKKLGPEIDFADPVQKWLWFGLFGLLLALILSIFNLGLGSLVAFLAVLCLIFWLLKLSNVV